MKYIYIIVRKDLSAEQIVVQSSHAALEAGLHFGNKEDDPYNFCILQVANKYDLAAAADKLALTNIQFRVFIEPYYTEFPEATAIATGPIFGEDRKFFKDYKLLKMDK